MKDFVRLARLRVPPSDETLLGLLGLSVLVAAARLAPGGHDVAVLLAVQSALLVFFGAAAVALVGIPSMAVVAFEASRRE